MQKAQQSPSTPAQMFVLKFLLVVVIAIPILLTTGNAEENESVDKESLSPWQTVYNGSEGFNFFDATSWGLRKIGTQLMQGVDGEDVKEPQRFQSFLRPMDSRKGIIEVPTVQGAFTPFLSLGADSLYIQAETMFPGRIDRQMDPYQFEFHALQLGSESWESGLIDVGPLFTGPLEGKGGIIGGFKVDNSTRQLIAVMTLRDIESDSLKNQLVFCELADGSYQPISSFDIRAGHRFCSDVFLLDDAGNTVIAAVFRDEIDKPTLDSKDVEPEGLPGQYSWLSLTIPDEWTVLGASDSRIYLMDLEYKIHAVELNGLQAVIGAIEESDGISTDESSLVFITYKVELSKD